MDWSTVIPMLISALVAGAATLATQLTKHLWAWLDDQHASVKQVFVALYVGAFSWLAATVGAVICTDGSTFCQATALDWNVILGAFGLSLAGHSWLPKSMRG